MSKNNTTFTNIAFILLIVFLLIAALKTNDKALDIESLLGWKQETDSTVLNKKMDLPALSNIKSTYETPTEEESTRDPNIVLKDFDSIKTAKQVKKSIDKSTAMNYTTTRSLSGTEMLALTKVKKIAEHLNQNKKVVIYVNKGSDSEIQAFIKEFSKSREKYRTNSKLVFIPLETLWDLNDDTIKNTHDRVIYNLKKDCGLFCILDIRGEKMIRLKGTTVSKKGAEIVDVILNSL